MVESRLVSRHKLPFAVCDWQVHRLNPAEEDAIAATRTQAHPAVCVTTVVIPSQSDPISLWIGLDEQSGFNQCLKAIADTENQLSVISELPQFIQQVMLDLQRQHLSGADIVTVAEPAGDAEDVMVMHLPGIGNERIDMHDLGARTGQLKRVSRILVAVCARSANQKYFRHRINSNRAAVAKSA